MTAPLLRDLLRAEGRVLGTWTQFTDPQFTDLLGACGYRFTIIDAEHGAFGVETAAALVRACEAAGVAPLARVPRGDHGLAGRLLDAGAAGIVAPGVESAEEVAAWVRALRFAPEGTRGACPIVRAAQHATLSWADTVARQAGTGLIALVETPQGVAAAGAIAAVPGLAALMVGPFDLAVAMGHPGEPQADAVQQAVRATIAAAQRAGVPVWMPVFAPQPEEFQRQMAHWAALGVRHFAIGADKIIAAAGLRQFEAWARA